MKYKLVPYIEQDCCTGCIAFGEKDICWALNDTCNDGIYIEDKEVTPNYPALLAECKPWLEWIKDNADILGIYVQKDKLGTLLADLKKAEEKSECKQ